MKAGDNVKRDKDLMRKILFAIEEQHEAGAGSIYNLQIKGFSMAVIAEHCDLLHQAGLVYSYDSEITLGRLCGFGVGKLTNSGHDYLDSARSGDE